MAGTSPNVAVSQFDDFPSPLSSSSSSSSSSPSPSPLNVARTTYEDMPEPDLRRGISTKPKDWSTKYLSEEEMNKAKAETVTSREFWATRIQKTQKTLDENLPEKIISEALGEHKEFFDDLKQFGSILSGMEAKAFWKDATPGFLALKKIIDERVGIHSKSVGISKTNLASLNMTMIHKDALSRYLSKKLLDVIYKDILEARFREIADATKIVMPVDGGDGSYAIDAVPYKKYEVGMDEGFKKKVLEQFTLHWVNRIQEVLDEPLSGGDESKKYLPDSLFPHSSLMFFETSTSHSLRNIISTLFQNILSKSGISKVNVKDLLERLFQEIPDYLMMFLKTDEIIGMQYQEFIDELNASEISFVSSILNNTTLSEEDAILIQFIDEHYVAMIKGGMSYFDDVSLSTLINSKVSGLPSLFADICRFKMIYEKSAITASTTAAPRALGHVRVIVEKVRSMLHINPHKRAIVHMSSSSSSSSSTNYYNYLSDGSNRSRFHQQLLHERIIRRMGN